MCKVTVEHDSSEHISDPTDAEVRKLGSWIDEGIRLACQANVCGSIIVKVPEDPLKVAIRKQLEQQKQDK